MDHDLISYNEVKLNHLHYTQVINDILNPQSNSNNYNNTNNATNNNKKKIKIEKNLINYAYLNKQPVTAVLVNNEENKEKQTPLIKTSKNSKTNNKSNKHKTSKDNYIIYDNSLVTKHTFVKSHKLEQMKEVYLNLKTENEKLLKDENLKPSNYRLKKNQYLALIENPEKQINLMKKEFSKDLKVEDIESFNLKQLKQNLDRINRNCEKLRIKENLKKENLKYMHIKSKFKQDYVNEKEIKKSIVWDKVCKTLPNCATVYPSPFSNKNFKTIKTSPERLNSNNNTKDCIINNNIDLKVNKISLSSIYKFSQNRYFKTDRSTSVNIFKLDLNTITKDNYTSKSIHERPNIKYGTELQFKSQMNNILADLTVSDEHQHFAVPKLKPNDIKKYNTLNIKKQKIYNFKDIKSNTNTSIKQSILQTSKRRSSGFSIINDKNNDLQTLNIYNDDNNISLHNNKNKKQTMNSIEIPAFNNNISKNQNQKTKSDNFDENNNLNTSKMMTKREAEEELLIEHALEYRKVIAKLNNLEKSIFKF